LATVIVKGAEAKKLVLVDVVGFSSTTGKGVFIKEDIAFDQHSETQLFDLRVGNAIGLVKTPVLPHPG
jgi:hypothetical protein